MFDKELYWKNRKEGKKGDGILPPWKKLVKSSDVQIQFIDGKMVAMPRYIRRKKGNRKK